MNLILYFNVFLLFVIIVYSVNFPSSKLFHKIIFYNKIFYNKKSYNKEKMK